ncbi:hypothetical protein ASPZODRAFT_22602 [Penicilliopsis zonata CBS 506.65]|uniref:Carbohydrate kinase PfkB domain-containing protein n=1 Tax=Penicilliopsis zonata CBS 506.65 TaxID=1073090 RepID=A0A1L9SRT8_9EURO|nr:hypothetical protein ASPZODRAFT_22602 [Penicilliopsis zonata CBS 506.65]OJJ49888.1 hypothetical protein ASPZODRAFT_22602 [Penicilliopsis zonata CBS 506.65]
MADEGRSAADRGSDVDFCSLAMFILDEIEFGDSRPAVKNVIGGAASFAAVGARLVAGDEHAQAVSWIVDTGSDFPHEALDVINSWGTSCVIREDRKRLTTRAWNGYGVNEKRDFKYLTPKLRMEASSLSEAQVLSRTFHMVCSASRCISLVEAILERREELRRRNKAPSAAHAAQRPIFVWEPNPDLCTLEEQEQFLVASQYVDVVSPNELELGTLFGRSGWSEDNADDRELVRRILDSGIGPQGEGFLVIRSGKQGSYSYSRTHQIWLPAYHQPGENVAAATSPVVDPTGAGNSFLGALAQGLVSTGRAPDRVVDSVLSGSTTWNRVVTSWGRQRHVITALICATVAAGFVVEQIGVPRISWSKEGKERWNETEFTERVRLYTQRLYRTVEESPSDIC